MKTENKSANDSNTKSNAKVSGKMSSNSYNIRKRIESFEPGTVFSPTSFYDLGSRSLIDQALCRFSGPDSFQKIGRGLYLKPKKHPVLGELTPDTEALRKAFEEKYGYKMKHTGAMAANMVGLSEQVPANYSFLTDGPTSVVKVQDFEINLKHASPRRMKSTDISSLVMEAFRYMGKENIKPESLNLLNEKLTTAQKNMIKDQSIFAPVWMAPFLEKVVT